MIHVSKAAQVFLLNFSGYHNCLESKRYKKWKMIKNEILTASA